MSNGPALPAGVELHCATGTRSPILRSAAAPKRSKSRSGSLETAIRRASALPSRSERHAAFPEGSERAGGRILGRWGGTTQASSFCVECSVFLRLQRQSGRSSVSCGDVKPQVLLGFFFIMSEGVSTLAVLGFDDFPCFLPVFCQAQRDAVSDTPSHPDGWSSSA